MSYTDLFESKRIEYYVDTGVMPNAVLMSSKFALRLSTENNIQLWDGCIFMGVEIIIVYNINPSDIIQFFRRIKNKEG